MRDDARAARSAENRFHRGLQPSDDTSGGMVKRLRDIPTPCHHGSYASGEKRVKELEVRGSGDGLSRDEIGCDDGRGILDVFRLKENSLKDGGNKGSRVEMEQDRDKDQDKDENKQLEDRNNKAKNEIRFVTDRKRASSFSSNLANLAPYTFVSSLPSQGGLSPIPSLPSSLQSSPVLAAFSPSLTPSVVPSLTPSIVPSLTPSVVPSTMTVQSSSYTEPVSNVTPSPIAGFSALSPHLNGFKRPNTGVDQRIIFAEEARVTPILIFSNDVSHSYF